MTAPTQDQGYARPELLVDTDWLQQHLDDPKVRVIDCDPIDAYRRAHVQGAVGLPVHQFLKDSADSIHVMPPDQFAALMGRLGVENDTTVVTYDAAGSLHAARVWWVLSYYGHTNVRVLNGGWQKWFAEGRPASLQPAAIAQTSYTPAANPDLLCTLDYAKSCVEREGVALLDVRSDGEWTGENARGNAHSGHVPGAVHLEWLNFMTRDEPRVFKPASELRAMLAEVAEGRPASLQPAAVAQTSYTPAANPDLLCTLGYAKSCVEREGVALLDVRSDGEWTGENARGNAHSGHVPGAVHLEWLNFMTRDEPRVFKPASELRAMLAEVGVTPEQEVVTY